MRKALVQAGVEAIITNKPDLCREVVDEKRPEPLA